MYTKNFEQLLRLLQVSKQSGLLTVEKAEQDESLWQGQIRLVEGNITTCLVWKKTDGQVLLRDDMAIRWLISQGKLNWQIEENVQAPGTFSSTSPLPGNVIERPRENIRPRPLPPSLQAPQLPSAWTPQRTQKGLQTQTRSLGSLEHLQVFILVNGQNTAEGIARLLRKPPERVNRLLMDLRVAGLIE